MNQHLIDAIKESGLRFIRTHRIDDQYVIHEATHKVGKVAFGQYLIMPMDSGRFLEITSDEATYSTFEDKILAPFYFRLKGDWGWNLYLCYVLEDRAFEEVPLERLVKVERSKKYAKKIVLRNSNIRDRIPAAKIPENLTGKVAADPIYDWERILAPLGLDFCLDDYKTANIEAYMENGSIHARSYSNPTSDQAGEIVAPRGAIQSLDFGQQFRSHLLSEASAIDFAKVNLLYGPNGMGKTSVLECIELSFTGSIQRNILSNASEPERWEGLLTFTNEEGEFRNTPDESSKKEREIAYYKHKVGRARSQINRLFHQYNFFSSEAVHQFCYSTHSRSNYRDDFARIIFGEQLQRMEVNWRRYKEEFEKSINRLNKQISDANEKAESIRNQDLQSLQLIVQRASSNVINMTRWANACKYVYPMIGMEESPEEIETWLLHLLPKIKEIDLISRPLLHRGLSKIDNENYLNRNIEEKSEALLTTNQLIEKTRQRIQQLQNQEAELIKQLQTEMVSKKKIENGYGRLSEIATALRTYSNVYDQPQLRNRRKAAQQRNDHLVKIISQLSEIQYHYKHLMDKKITIANLQQAEDEMNQLTRSRSEAAQLFNDVSEQVTRHEEKIGKLQRLASALKATGMELLVESPGQTHCPLCNHDYENHELLLAAIENGLAADDAILTKLMEEKEKNRAILLRMDTSMQNLTNQIQLYKQFEKAHNVFLDNAQWLGFEISQSFSPEKVKNLLSRLDHQLITAKQEYQQVKDEITNLEQNGFSLEVIDKVENIWNDEILDSIRSNISDHLSSDQLLLMFDKEMRLYGEQLKYFEKESSIKQEELEVCIQENVEKNNHLKDLEQQIKDIETTISHLGNAKHAFEKLREKNVWLETNTSWKGWRSYFEQLLSEAEHLQENLKPAILIEHNRRQLKELHEEISQKEALLDKVEQAVKALSKLRPLSEYSDDFVRFNFEAISKLFLALHTPNEFISLALTEENDIVAKRKGYESDCAIYQMSTGQRTAVALAIFFVMHLAMETAPKFLLLDEPVANMDELNVLGLLDFLRQLAVTQGTQIFFTTANPQVATLFRRKFSFFKDQFRAFHFQRYLEGPVRIRMQQFEPHKEAEVYSIKL
ncbi:AAA family ATPase [Paenibacillus sp. J2TS4]|uniref:AAA family ATPase n=1 Tax=Paenibacillus sp. J2TS4 TaxID=2807194 RepID=UPI001B237007|nr:AAA family ATPase [Paenibacillus sp. J2TS4]GIP34249.1 hypothetical protein J2TS4_34590 [Paenibacillus sp. J2TS4]